MGKRTESSATVAGSANVLPPTERALPARATLGEIYGRPRDLRRRYEET